MSWLFDPSHYTMSKPVRSLDAIGPAFCYSTLSMKKKPASVCTIGYEQSCPTRFAELLASAKIDLLVDVRAVPLSRKPGFSKNRLATDLSAAGVEYKHMVRLGAPREIRDALREGGSWSEYERCYYAYLNGCGSEIQALLDLASERMICLLCFERQPEVCHRSLIARRMRDEQPGLVIQHIRY